MWTCQNCQLRNWDEAKSCNRCKTARFSAIAELAKKKAAEEKAAKAAEKKAAWENSIRKADVTHLIERLEVFEERMEVRLDALFAKLEDGFLTVNFELYSRDGNLLKRETKLVVTAYDAAGRLLAQATNTSFVEEFFGFETYSFNIHVPGQIAKIRVIPKPPRG